MTYNLGDDSNLITSSSDTISSRLSFRQGHLARILALYNRINSGFRVLRWNVSGLRLIRIRRSHQVQHHQHRRHADERGVYEK